MVKTSQLVAWTENGRVRMLPYLVRQMAQPFIERIEDINSLRPFNFREQPKYLIQLSRAYENLGRFFTMYGQCRRLLRKHPALRNTASFAALMDDYKRVTAVTGIWHEELEEGMENARAWHFRG